MKGPYQIQIMLNSGGREIFIAWLKTEIALLKEDKNSPIELISSCIQILEHVLYREFLFHALFSCEMLTLGFHLIFYPRRLLGHQWQFLNFDMIRLEFFSPLPI